MAHDLKISNEKAKSWHGIGAETPKTEYIPKQKTKVIFRKFKKDQEIVAIFPEILGNKQYVTCSAYCHNGQHWNVNIFDVIEISIPAKENEYNALKAELENIGYNLEIIKRNRRKFTETRIKKLNEIK